MRINHNISAMITQAARNQNLDEENSSLEKLSTGLRINRASDDAAGLSVSEQMRTQINGMGRAKQNAQDGIALLNIAEGAGNEMSAILQRMRELAVQSSNDTLTSTDRSYLQQEFSGLTQEIDRISKATNYNGQTLIYGGKTSFGGVGSGSCFLQIGANAALGVDVLNIKIDGISASALGLSMGSARGHHIAITNHATALKAITAIDGAIKSVNKMRSDLGAYTNRLQHAINNLDNQQYNTQDAESRIRDVDFAAESTAFSREQILAQSSTSMLSQANQMPQGVLSLLGH